MKTLWISLILLLSLALGSCGSSQTALPTPTSVSPTQGESTQMPASQPTPADPVMQSLISQATADLAQKLTVSPSQINLIKALSVTWSDGSLGCPQTGMVYTQALVSGYLIVLENNNTQYEYHSAEDGSIAYCQNPTAPASKGETY